MASRLLALVAFVCGVSANLTPPAVGAVSGLSMGWGSEPVEADWTAPIP